jgi:hypothetical protein|tara:strand:- start:3306 stop:4034 length:729 start_codon:yes stop_codon:yes gene_type:complete
MKKTLVIVDAWFLDNWSELLTKRFGKSPVPDWPEDVKYNVKYFSKFLSYVCDYERNKGTTIIHSLGTTANEFVNEIARENASQVKIRDGDTIAASDSIGEAILTTKADVVFWGGFHFGKCIHSHSNQAYQYLNRFAKFNINSLSSRSFENKVLNLVLNLSMTLPGHSWKDHINGKKAWDVKNYDELTAEERETVDKNKISPENLDSGTVANYNFNPVSYNHCLWSFDGFERLFNYLGEDTNK